MTLSHARQEELVPHLSAGRAQSRDNAGPQFGKPKIPSLPLNGLLHEPRQTLNLTWEYHSTNKEIEKPQVSNEPQKNELEGRRKDERGDGEEWDMPGRTTQARRDSTRPNETILITNPHTKPPPPTLYAS